MKKRKEITEDKERQAAERKLMSRRMSRQFCMYPKLQAANSPKS
jgi:hypothetical protein